MWWFKWHSRRIVRAYMNPIPAQRAIIWLRRLRMLYLFIAWNGFCLAYYTYKKYEERREEKGFISDISKTHKRLRLSGVEESTIYRVGWGQPLQKRQYNREEYIKQQADRERIARHEYLAKLEEELREAQQLADDDDDDRGNDSEIMIN